MAMFVLARMGFGVVGERGFSSGPIGLVASYLGTGACLTGSGD